MQTILSKNVAVAQGMFYFSFSIYFECYNLLKRNTYFGSAQVMMPEKWNFVRQRWFELKILNSGWKQSSTMHNDKNFALD